MWLLRNLIALLVLSACLAAMPRQAHAQLRLFQPQSDIDIALPDYLAKTPEAKLIEPGKLKIDDHSMSCGRRPTVIDNTFESWGGAYPGYVILNMDRLKALPTPVKLFVFAHECGHQFVGRDESKADCFGIKRGRRYGWLKEEGLAQVCDFISELKGDADHADGPKRCARMRKCYVSAAPRAAGN